MAGMTNNYNPFSWKNPIYHILWIIDCNMHIEMQRQELLTGECPEMGRFHAKICNMLERELANRSSE